MLHARAQHGNPFDGHTPAAAVGDVQAMTGIEVWRIREDRGYRGHNYPNRFRVWSFGQFRRVSPALKKEKRRRAAVEPVTVPPRPRFNGLKTQENIPTFGTFDAEADRGLENPPSVADNGSAYSNET